MGLAPGKGVERKRYELIRFLENYRKGYNIGFFRRMKKVCCCGLSFFVVFKVIKKQHIIIILQKLTATILVTVNSLLIFNILIYFSVFDFSLLNPLLILKN